MIDVPRVGGAPKALGTVLLAIVVLFGLSACATNGNKNKDPFEGINRFFFSVNDVLDKTIGRPVSGLYVLVVPEPVRDGLHNGIDNLGYLNVILNDFLQGKVDQGLRDCLRMLVNSTLGIAGIFDVATGMRLERHAEDFGQTLAVWGVEQGTYIVLPLLGPTTTRDVWSVPVAIATNPLVYGDLGATVLVVGGFKAVDGRARVDEKLRQVEQAALDRYVFTREAFLARREFLVNDGAVSPETEDALYEDFGDDELDQE